jgi:hypothetical protein
MSVTLIEAIPKDTRRCDARFNAKGQHALWGYRT